MAMRSMLTSSSIVDSEADPSYFPFNGNTNACVSFTSVAEKLLIINNYYCTYDDYVIINRLFGHIVTRDYVTSLLALSIQIDLKI